MSKPKNTPDQPSSVSRPSSQPRLTSLSHGGGCGCKIAPGVLSSILKSTTAMPIPKELLVGIETSDDAAVYQLNDEQALIATTDFFMPIVDDPFDFGRIAATNALSDVYAMGEKIGVTPLQLNRDKVFPNLYAKEKESLYGRVTLRKAGCLDFTRTISTEIGNNGLHAQMDCGDKNPAAAPHTSETVEQRLDKIKDLLNKGLITEDEAKQARERILKEL